MNLTPIVFIVDDDPFVLDLIKAHVQSDGLEVQTFNGSAEFASFNLPDRVSCVLLDLEMPGVSGLELAERHLKLPKACPVIVVTAHASVSNAVKTMKMGAVDFLEKPFERTSLLHMVRNALEADRQNRLKANASDDVRKRIGTLSPRERELLAAVIGGKSTKMIADELGISARTVDHHRANLMEKMHAANVADLVRMAVETDFTFEPSK